VRGVVWEGGVWGGGGGGGGGGGMFFFLVVQHIIMPYIMGIRSPSLFGNVACFIFL